MVPTIAPNESQTARTEASTRYALFLIGIAPIILITFLIGKYAVNVPYGDEWSLIPLFTKIRDHELTFSDLFGQHNEHRILVPKLIYIAFAQLMHWNVRAEMFFSILLATAMSSCIYVLLRRTTSASIEKNLLLWALANVLIFGPVQAENWLWGFQLLMFIPALCLAAALVMLAPARIDSARFAGACTCATIAAFSCGNGLLLWPLIGLYLLLVNGKRWAAMWIAVGLVVNAVYFVGYERAAIAHPVGNWFDYVVYFGGFLGVPLVRLPTQHPIVLTSIVGLLATILFLLATISFLKKGPFVRQKIAPWLVLGFYAILSAALAGYARIAEGPQQAMDSRYATVAMNLYLSLCALLVIASRTTDFNDAIIKKFQIPFITVVLTLHILGLPGALDHMTLLHDSRQVGLANLQFCKVLGTTRRARNDLMILRDLPTVNELVETLDRLQFLRPPIRQSKILEDGENRPRRSTTEFGQTEEVSRKDAETFVISGWSFLPELERPAPCVVLAYRFGDQWIAFALSDMREPRPDLVQRTKNRKYLTAGWRASTRREILPPDAEQISAWALDPDAGDVYKLPGDFRLPR